MADALDGSALARWRREPIKFIEQVLRDPETEKPFDLFAAQREYFAHAWRTGDDGRLLYPEQIFAAPKKTGKTATAAIHLLVTTLIFGGRFAEGYAIANDLEQAQGRVFQAVRRIVEASPHLRREAEITAPRISFPETGAVIAAIAADYAGAAGSAPASSAFDELWAFTSERSRRLWDEMVPVPTRKISCRLTTTYAGFSGESELLEELCKRGLQQPVIADDLRAGDGLLFYWTHRPQAPWQTEAWLADMRRSLRPMQYSRMIENRFVTSESAFIPMSAWDRCVQPQLAKPQLTPLLFDRSLSVWIGVDAAHKHDSAAIVVVTFDQKCRQVRLVWHWVFQPTPERPLDFEESIEGTLLDLKQRFWIKKVLFDPWQMQAVAQRLARQGLPIEEFPQSPPNLTAASQNLYDLIMTGGLVLYPDAAMRVSASQAVAVETPRGWRIAKEKQSHKIDSIVALGMACHAATTGGNVNAPLDYSGWLDKDADDERTEMERWRMARYAWYFAAHGMAAPPF